MMRLLVVGLNHKTAPLQVRERLAFSPGELNSALLSLKNRFEQCEAVLLSTCNRVELYMARQMHGHPRSPQIAEFFAENRRLDLGDFQSHLYEKSEREVVTHLFSVAASLDSMVLGETQILSQVREAYDAATEAGTAGPMLHPLFQRAVAVGKQVRSETTLSEGRVSVASVAVDYARRIFDIFSDKTVLSIGAGKMSAVVLARMAELKPRNLLVCNRDPTKAENLARQCGGTAVDFNRLADHLAVADIVITGTGSSQPIVTRAMVEAALRRRRYKAVFMIDIAVPRDVAADVAKIENVYVYNLDDLQQVVSTTLDSRSAAAMQAGRIIEDQVRGFATWHRARMMGPLIDQLYQRSHAVAQDELNRSIAKLSSISESDRQQLEELTRRIVNKLLHDPIQVLRETHDLHTRTTPYLHAVEKLFKLEDAPAHGGKPADEDAKPGGAV
jgi:glutamyl-tRNA reductase